MNLIEFPFLPEQFGAWLFLLIGVGVIFSVLYSLRNSLDFSLGKEVSSNRHGLGSWAYITASTALGFFVLSIITVSPISSSWPFAFSHLALISILLSLMGIIVYRYQRPLIFKFKFQSFAEMAGDYYQSKALCLMIFLTGVLFFLSCLGVLFISFELLFLKADILISGVHSIAVKELTSIKLTNSFVLNNSDLVLSTFLISFIGIQISPLINQLVFSVKESAVKESAVVVSQLVWGSSFFTGGMFLCVSFFIALSTHEIRTGLFPKSFADGSQMDLFFLLAIIIFFIIGVALIKLMSSMLTIAFSSQLEGNVIARMIRKPSPKLFIIVLCFLSFALAFYAPDFLLLMMSLCIAFSFQLLPAFIGICFVPSMNGAGMLAGLLVGLGFVLLTSQTFTTFSFSSYSFGIHPAILGGGTNFFVALIVSHFTQTRNGLAHRLTFHECYQDYYTQSKRQPFLIAMAWGLLFIWLFFAVGPGSVLGHDFLALIAQPGSWLFSFPSILIWHSIWWIVGVFLIWLLVYLLQLSKIRPSPHRTPLSY